MTVSNSSGDSASARRKITVGHFSLTSDLHCTGLQPGTGWCRLKQLPTLSTLPVFFGRYTGWAVGAADEFDSRRTVFRTTDGGLNWVARPVDFDAEFHFIDSLRALAFPSNWRESMGTEARGLVQGWETRDGGASWAPRTAPVIRDYFNPPELIQACCTNKSHESRPKGARTPSGVLYRLASNALPGQAAEVRRSTDLGESETAVPVD